MDNDEDEDLFIDMDVPEPGENGNENEDSNESGLSGFLSYVHNDWSVLLSVNLQCCLYTSSPADQNIHCCVIVFDRHHAITFQHHPHDNFKEGQTLLLYGVSLDLRIEVKVVVVSQKHDFVIFKRTTQDFPHFPIGFGQLSTGQRYVQLGVNNERSPKWNSGIISQMGRGYFIGTSHGEYGDSGSGIFDHGGRFIGFSLAKKRFEFSLESFDGSKLNFDQLADHHPYTQIKSADLILAHIEVEDKGFSSQPEKKQKQ